MCGGAWCDPRFVSLDMARLNRAYQIQARRKWGGRLGIQKWLEVRRWKCPPLQLISDASRPLFLTASADPGDSSCNLNLSGTFLRQTSYGRHVTDISQLYSMLCQAIPAYIVDPHNVWIIISPIAIGGLSELRASAPIYFYYAMRAANTEQLLRANPNEVGFLPASILRFPHFHTSYYIAKASK